MLMLPTIKQAANDNDGWLGNLTGITEAERLHEMQFGWPMDLEMHEEPVAPVTKPSTKRRCVACEQFKPLSCFPWSAARNGKA